LTTAETNFLDGALSLGMLSAVLGLAMMETAGSIVGDRGCR